MVTHRYLCNLARQSLRVTGRRSDELNWTALPLFHLNALAATVAASILIGGSASIYSRFSLSNFWPEMERTGARVVNLVGAMIPLIAGMNDTPEMLACKGQIRAVLGIPFSPEAMVIWRDRFGVEKAYAPAYGLTETGMIIESPAAEEPPPGSSGRCSPDFDVRIVDEADVEVQDGTVGEVVVRPLRPNVMFSGYWKRPEATIQVTRNLWFHTGDLGKFDRDGWFYFVDRKKDYLRRRGENISSVEVERTFQQHPDVEEVAVHSVRSDLSEDEVKVTVVLRPGSPLTEDQLCRWSAERLPYFAVPRYVEFRKGLPKNLVERILKYQLREEGCTETTWDREAAGLTLEKR